MKAPIFSEIPPLPVGSSFERVEKPTKPGEINGSER